MELYVLDATTDPHLKHEDLFLIALLVGGGYNPVSVYHLHIGAPEGSSDMPDERLACMAVA